MGILEPKITITEKKETSMMDSAAAQKGQRKESMNMMIEKQKLASLNN